MDGKARLAGGTAKAGLLEVNIGKLSMIDLAGSERASQTNNKGANRIMFKVLKPAKFRKISGCSVAV